MILSLVFAAATTVNLPVKLVLTRGGPEVLENVEKLEFPSWRTSQFKNK